MVFGLAGILIARPHADLWANNPALVQVYQFGMSHGGATHILFGAATMLIFGLYAIGWRRTLVFFAVGTILPLGAELLGTKTGWPFGGYAYTDFLGYKVSYRVPYSVPLSWFYMGFASYLLASVIVGRRRVRFPAVWSVLLGAWLLMAWDLVLDPAMASPAMVDTLHIQFWTWQEHGAYFGMPLRNLAGWFGTGLAFIALSRIPFRGEPDPRKLPAWLPFGVYVANVLWAMALSLGVGLWPTALAAVVFSILPACLALFPLDRPRASTTGARSETAPLAPGARQPSPGR
jgi:uncharacterized membrane protein